MPSEQKKLEGSFNRANQIYSISNIKSLFLGKTKQKFEILLKISEAILTFYCAEIKFYIFSMCFDGFWQLLDNIHQSPFWD